MSETLKTFVGGLSQETTKASLDAYFNQFGTADSFIMVDKMTGRSRGFGFVNFADEAVVQQCISCQHVVDGTTVTCSAYAAKGGGKGPGGGGGGAGMFGGLSGGAGGFGGGVATNRDSCKVFVGGLSQATSKQSLDAYFMQFGQADSHVMLDGATGRSRGFGFVNFQDEEVLNVVLQMRHEVDGVPVNVSAYAEKGGPGKGAAGFSLATGGKGAAGFSLATGGRGGGAKGGAAQGAAAAAIAQVMQSPAIAQLLGGQGGQQAHAVQMMVQQAVQQVVGGGGGAPAAPVINGGIHGRPGSGRGPSHLKCFVGGLSPDSTKESLAAYFSQFGQADAIVMMDRATGRSRGFGFVDFQDDHAMNVVLQSAHQVDGQSVTVSAYGGKGGGGGRSSPF